MPLLRRPSLGSLSALLEILEADHDPHASFYSSRPVTPEKALPAPPDSPLMRPESPRDDAASSTSSLLNPPVITKRTHALLELLTSERAYASDLALIRDIHIPLALGQPAPFSVTTPAVPALSSGCSSRTVSTASDSSTSSSQLGPPMSRDDTRIIFGNIADLAIFANQFVERLEVALGSVLEGGVGEDHVGKLFLELIPALEPPYKTYITRHPTALAHLQALPSSPALTTYLERTRTLASSLTHAWDLPSLLIKPVQRLLKYSLLLGAIIDETADTHPDKENLRAARTQMEEVARGVNEGRRRWEVVKEVLNAKTGDAPKKKGVGVGVAASVNLSRMKSLRGVKVKENNEEAEQVAALEAELKRYPAFLKQIAKDAVDWRTSAHAVILRLKDWAIAFGKVIGLSEEQKSEAFDAFMGVVADLVNLSHDLEVGIKEIFLADLASLKESMKAPFKLIEAMNTLEPLHYGLANLNFSKNRPPPALLEASQSYLALRGQLCAELPQYLSLLNTGTGAAVVMFADMQAQFWAEVRDRWFDLWDALRVEGERNAGSEETLRVWWERWGDADRAIQTLNVVNPKKIYAERPARPRTSASAVVATLATLDPVRTPPNPPSPQNHKPHHHHSHSSTDMGGRRRSGSNAQGGVARKTSCESLRSGKSTKSSKSGKSNRNSRPEEFLYELAPPLPTPTSRSSRQEEYLYDAAPPMPTPSPKAKPKPSRIKSMPAVTPVRTSTSSSSSQILRDQDAFPPSPLSFDPDDNRGRLPARRPSLKSKITEPFRPSHHRRRSSSVKSLGAPSTVAPSYHTTDIPLPLYHRSSSTSQRTEVLQHTKALYQCHAVHPCYPPNGVSYRGLPFFQLDVGDVYDVLREYGHPSTHEDLPLYVDDGEDCLLLVRDKPGEVGWALASFLIPLD
ncbi:hypothetical protein BV22DRAFT_1018978 [Leucogyrophana mollusca]|uniref:Uncharacterized protein n=1 Tax=Leucogyrophana mollusca TaxID=85980 RepID=A0ACB8B8V8_9AGAM|nr:hypothetical protein BV22DRAFT_1018978 [Leucogyrophana mollusca]